MTFYFRPAFLAFLLLFFSNGYAETCIDDLAARAKTGKVQLIWTAVPDSTKYEIFRAVEGSARDFLRIAETLAESTLYLDSSVASGVTHVYRVDAILDSESCSSNVVASHPPARRTRGVNYAPVIYSTPMEDGSPGEMYSYDVDAVDPNLDPLQFQLTSAPAGMVIGPNSGLIEWTSAGAQSVAVAVEVRDPDGATDSQDYTLTISEPSNGALGGNPTDPAKDAIVDLITFGGLDPGSIDIDEFGLPVARSRLEIDLAPGVTVGEVNALLQNLDATIISMIEGTSFLHIGFPDPGDLDGLASIIAQIQASGIAADIFPYGIFRDIDVLPGNYSDPPPPSEVLDIFHHLAVRAHAAWNARSALNQAQAPRLLVQDSFGYGEPSPSSFDGQIINPLDWINLTPPCTVIDKFARIRTDYSNHGYHVLGLAIAKFGAGRPVGAYPAQLQVEVADILRFGADPAGNEVTDCTSQIFQKESIDWAVIDHLTLLKIRNSPKRVVLNISQGETGAGGCSLINFFDPVQCLGKQAEKWTKKVQQMGIRDKYFHVTSAGNEMVNAREENFLAQVVNALGNGLIVENRRVTLTNPPKPACELRASSNFGGDISAIGQEVISNFDNEIAVGMMNGTSQSAPQVAALAAFLWTLRPNLTVDQLGDLIKKSAGDIGGCGDQGPAGEPVIDSYRAVLATDISLDPAGAPVRIAILDIVGEEPGQAGDPLPVSDTMFTDADLLRFVAEFESRSSEVMPDYSRFDLNGDGFTGKDNLFAPMDLDANFNETNNPFTFAEIQIGQETIQFDETAVTDWQALCYYAFSGLYTSVIGLGNDNIEILLPHLSKCGLKLNSVTVTVGDTDPNWNIPTVFTITSFGPASKLYNGSGCFERGTPFFSGEPRAAGATFLPYSTPPGVPFRSDLGVNRQGCSNFVAFVDGKVWINATARIQRFSQFSFIDFEHQTRYFSGSPDQLRIDRFMSIGLAPSFFTEAVAPAAFSVEYGIGALP